MNNYYIRKNYIYYLNSIPAKQYELCSKIENYKKFTADVSLIKSPSMLATPFPLPK